MKQDILIVIISSIGFTLGITVAAVAPMVKNQMPEDVCKTYCNTSKAYWDSTENICRCISIEEDNDTITRTTYTLECNGE